MNAKESGNEEHVMLLFMKVDDNERRRADNQWPNE